MRLITSIAIATLTAACLISGIASAQAPATQKSQSSNAQQQYTEDGKWSVRGGFGFTGSPTSFLLGFEGDYRLNNNLSTGLRMELGMKTNLTIVSPQGYLRYTFGGGGGKAGPIELARLRPFIQGGLGLTYYDTVVASQTAFLMSFGGGVEYWLNDNLSLASQMYFNFLPTRALGDVFYYSWEMVSVKLRF